MNNQMEFVTYTMVDEKKEGNNLLNSVNMKYNSSTSEAPDRTAMTTAVVLYYIFRSIPVHFPAAYKA